MPKMIDKLVACTDEEGRFLLSFKTDAAWMLKVAYGSRQLGYYITRSPPPEVKDAESIYVTVRIDQGIADFFWREDSAGKAILEGSAKK
jgi:hypothetical protein